MEKIIQPCSSHHHRPHLFQSPGVQVPRSFQRTTCTPRSPRYHRAQSLVQPLGNWEKKHGKIHHPVDFPLKIQ